MCEYISLHVCLYTMLVQYLWRPEKGVWNWSCQCLQATMLESNPGPLEEQPGFLTINSVMWNKTFPEELHHTHLLS